MLRLLGTIETQIEKKNKHKQAALAPCRRFPHSHLPPLLWPPPAQLPAQLHTLSKPVGGAGDHGHGDLDLICGYFSVDIILIFFCLQYACCHVRCRTLGLSPIPLCHSRQHLALCSPGPLPTCPPRFSAARDALRCADGMCSADACSCGTS